MIAAVVLALAAHSASEGRSRFDVQRDGVVVIDVQLSALDLPELCGLELADGPDHRLDACVARGFPQWLMLRTPQGPCPLASEGWRVLEPPRVPPQLGLAARARCPGPVVALTVDWGFFRGTGLDHTSVARFTALDVPAQVVALSGRAPRAELTFAPSRSGVVVVVGVVCVLVLVAALVRAFSALLRARG